MKAKRPCPEALARAADLKSQVATCDAEVATLEAAMGGRPQAASKISGGGGSGGGGGGAGAGVRDPPSEPGAAGATLAQPHPGGFRALQFTLVDCPGHASLIRTGECLAQCSAEQCSAVQSRAVQCSAVQTKTHTVPHTS